MVLRGTTFVLSVCRLLLRMHMHWLPVRFSVSPPLQAAALRKLDGVVSDFWAEISEALPDIESLYEDEAFAERQLAALLASKVTMRHHAKEQATSRPLLLPTPSMHITQHLRPI
eukprot:2302699-Pleurochrysis_carterae.AAC.2